MENGNRRNLYLVTLSGGGPSRAKKLSPIQERLYDLLGRDVGEPLPGVRHNPLIVSQSQNSPALVEVVQIPLAENSEILEEQVVQMLDDGDIITDTAVLEWATSELEPQHRLSGVGGPSMSQEANRLPEPSPPTTTPAPWQTVPPAPRQTESPAPRQTVPSAPRRRRRRVQRSPRLVNSSVSMSMVTLGVLSGWVTVVLPKFKNNETNVAIDEYETPTMLALLPVGFAVGSLATGYIADRFGRRTTILASALPITLGSIIIAFALKAWQVWITTFSWSCGTGMVSTVINYYLSEIADKDVRGTLSLITGFMFKLGSLLVMSAGPFLSYKTLNFIMLALPVLFFLTCCWIPETPYYCLKNGNVEGARRSLRILRGYKDEKVLEDELQALQVSVKNEMKHSSSVKELFVGVQYRKAIIISAGLKLTQLMTGAVVIRQYLGWIIDETKLQMDKSLVPLIYGAVIFVVSMVSSVLVDRVGRRSLLVFSYMGTGASLGAVGFYFFLQEVINVSTETLTTLSFIPLAGIILANVISTLGFSSLIFIIPAEIFPMNVKAIAMTCLSLFGSALAFIISLAYQRLKDLCGLTAIFWIFAGFAFGGSVFCTFWVTETKGKHLRDIQVELQGDGFDAVAVADELEKIVTSNDENNEGTEMEALKKKDDL